MLLKVISSECSAVQDNLHKGVPYRDKQKLRNSTHEENVCIKQFALRQRSFLIVVMSL